MLTFQLPLCHGCSSTTSALNGKKNPSQAPGSPPGRLEYNLSFQKQMWLKHLPCMYAFFMSATTTIRPLRRNPKRKMKTPRRYKQKMSASQEGLASEGTIYTSADSKNLGTPQSHLACPWQNSQLTPLLLSLVLCFLPLFKIYFSLLSPKPEG